LIVAAVVLAAGKSTRMGRNKLLLEVGGRTVLDRILDAIEASAVDETIVVLGHEPEEVRPIVDTHGVSAVLNPEHEKGMTSSFQAGLREVTVDAAFLMLGDQLRLDPALLDEMVGLMSSNPDAMITSPVHNGRRGHPVLFRRTLFNEILDLADDETVKDVVLRHEKDHRSVRGSRWCTLDIDTPEDFERAVKLFEADRASL
jgi:molybdenum cofactor cytidylyltransferase